MRRSVLAADLLAALTAGFVVAPVGPAGAVGSVQADYRFANTEKSSVLPTSALADLIGCAPGCGGTNGPNTFVTANVDGGPARAALAVPRDNGVAITSVTHAIASDNYTVVLLVSLESGSGWRRLVDFKGGTSDSGLYVDPNNFVDFYNHAAGATPVAAGQWLQIALTRNSRNDKVIGYLDGVEEFSYTDTVGDAIIDSSDVLRFLQDNTTGCSCGEDSAATLARIRLYDGPLSATAVAALDRAAPLASLTVSPGSAAPGSTVTLTGQYFGVRERVALTFVDAAGVRTSLGTRSTTADGAFGASPQVPAGAATGTARFLATGATSGLTASVRIRVSSG